MEQFSLEEYLKNPDRKITTKDGANVRIVCTDVKNGNYPILALIDNRLGDEFIAFFDVNGNAHNTSYSLFFEPNQKTKKIGWMNVCKYGDGKHFTIVGNVVFPTREEALNCKSEYSVDTIQIRWEEE